MHSVEKLDLHLPDQQNVHFEPGEEQEALDRRPETKLMQWFALNAREPGVQQYLYTEIPQHYTRKNKTWQPCRQGSSVTCLYTVSLKNVKLFHLQLLLLDVRGATSLPQRYPIVDILC